MTRKIKVTVYSGFVGANHIVFHDLPEDWDEMSEQEQNSYLDELAVHERDERIEFGAEVVETT